jgi:hypothetical protein
VRSISSARMLAVARADAGARADERRGPIAGDHLLRSERAAGGGDDGKEHERAHDMAQMAFFT